MTRWAGLRLAGLAIIVSLGIAGSVAAQTDAPPAAPGPQPQRSSNLASLEQVLGKDAATVARLARDVWNVPLVLGADQTPIVTVGTLAGGSVLLGLGYLAAGMISRWLAGKLVTRFGLAKSGVAPLQSITFYVLLATFTMASLNVLNVPMTVFSFLGGALAIGAGFGSQNIVNNFISGLILLAERPIRVGDVIELEGATGTVTHIGARSTKIATGANHEIIVPNSKLLETSVVNWTLSDDVVGCTIKVGASYGSPTREVERLLKFAAEQHPGTLQNPAPDIVFSDFGADALLFELRFWVNLRTVRKSEVESDLRYAIDQLFADRGIVMAYPQRDVHLNVLRPVEVRLTQPLSSMSSGKAAA